MEIVPDPPDDIPDLRVDDVQVVYRPDKNFAPECWMENLQPNPPTPVSPANNSVFPLSSVTLQVNDAGDPDNQPNNYRNYNFTITTLDNSWAATSGWILPNSWTVSLPTSGTYKWYVRAGDGALQSVTSPEWSFAYTPSTLSDKTPPTGAITSPDPNTYFTQPQFNVAATASDAGGSGVDTVKFYSF
jgi:hypothetical protein